MAFTGLFVVLSFVKPLLPNFLERLAHGIIGTLAALFVTSLFLWFDKKNFSDIELYFERKTIIRFFSGVAFGILIMGSLAAGVIYVTHVAIELNPKANVWQFGFVTASLIPLAFMEELCFRAYPLHLLKDKTGIRPAICITSILFALYHIANGWTVVSSFVGPAVWGLLFGLAAICSKGIAMPTGIHYAANLTTAAFGAKENTTAIWMVAPIDTIKTTFYGVDWAIILPSLALLLLGWVSMEVYLSRNQIATTTIGS